VYSAVTCGGLRINYVDPLVANPVNITPQGLSVCYGFGELNGEHAWLIQFETGGDYVYVITGESEAAQWINIDTAFDGDFVVADMSHDLTPDDPPPQAQPPANPLYHNYSLFANFIEALLVDRGETWEKKSC
jgi:hypothetical protein